jgi:uncharacterized protein (DUF924 family)
LEPSVNYLHYVVSAFQRNVPNNNCFEICYSVKNEVIMPDRIHELLNFWFGNVGSADLPSSDRTRFWFGENDKIKESLLEGFSDEYQLAITGNLNEWAITPRGRLALIILLDQFPRYIHKQSANAYAYDTVAQVLCLEGLRLKLDHALTLIERVFFYMPLVHSEDQANQDQSIHLYQELVSLSLSETTQIYQLFLAYAYAHYRVIKEFGRFPQRNIFLQRASTEEEKAFLRNK